MASTNPIFSYTNRDYESSRQESISKIPYVSKGDWTDTNATDPGVIIIDHVHALVDMMQYYMDHNALESYIVTAKERKNIFRIAKQLGYRINCAKGASVMVQFSTKRSYDSAYTIPKYTVVSTGGQNKIPYLTTSDLIIYQGIIRGEVLCIQGTLVEFPYYGTGTSSLDGSINAADQYVIIDNVGVDYDSITISDDNGYNWTQVDNVYFSDPNAREFSTELLADGKVRIQFGTGERGYSPSSTDVLTIKYIYSLGEDGRVADGAITSIDQIGKFVTENGETVTDLQVTNLESSFGGTNPEDSELIRLLAPAVIKTQDRAVTLADFEALARKVPGVMDAKAYDIKNAPENFEIQYYEVKVLVLPESGMDESMDILKKNVSDYLSKRMIPPTVLSIITPENKVIDIAATVVINNRYTEEYIRYEITKNLTEFFSDLSSTIGGSINPNALISLISKVDGVLYVQSFSPNETIDLKDLEIPTLGGIDITIVRRES